MIHKHVFSSRKSVLYKNFAKARTVLLIKLGMDFPGISLKSRISPPPFNQKDWITGLTGYNRVYSWLLRLSTARGSGTGLVTVGPTKV